MKHKECKDDAERHQIARRYIEKASPAELLARLIQAHEECGRRTS